MTKALTVPAKHIYLDVVRFTRDRSVEAQADIVSYLNRIVSETIAESSVEEDQVIFLPTGDGLCIVLLAVHDPYDIHLRIALGILKRLQEHNEGAADRMRQFSVRIGVNENVDNLVMDITDRRNIAGAGINLAQRVMTFADENQVFLGPMVYETLRQREPYMAAFREYTSEIKHGARLTAYQYIEDGRPGLYSRVPKAFLPKPRVKQALPRQIAFYLAHCATERSFLIAHSSGQQQYAGICLMWYLAHDSSEREETPGYKDPILKAPEGATRKEQLHKLISPHFYVVADLARHIKDCELEPFYECFEEDDYRFISEKGLLRLKDEHPDIWEAFRLTDLSSNV